MSLMPEESLERDPEFVAMHIRAQLVEDIYKAMEFFNLKTIRQLAKKTKMKQGYLKKVLREQKDLTMDEVINISVKLGLYLHFRMICPDQVLVSMSDDQFSKWKNN